MSDLSPATTIDVDRVYESAVNLEMITMQPAEGCMHLNYDRHGVASKTIGHITVDASICRIHVWPRENITDSDMELLRLRAVDAWMHIPPKHTNGWKRYPGCWAMQVTTLA